MEGHGYRWHSVRHLRLGEEVRSAMDTSSRKTLLLISRTGTSGPTSRPASSRTRLPLSPSSSLARPSGDRTIRRVRGKARGEVVLVRRGGSTACKYCLLLRLCSSVFFVSCINVYPHLPPLPSGRRHSVLLFRARESFAPDDADILFVFISAASHNSVPRPTWRRDSPGPAHLRF